ncbi:MAG TPA: hypothetical protein VND64_33475 [Pirellulales bacterium]|nr:hypothetical protein [Pirellulales bacterium]
MAIDSLFPYLWDQLPDPAAANSPNGPGTSVELLERHWRKIVRKHFTRRSEPWRDFIPATALNALKASPYGPFDAEPLRQATIAALARLGEEFAACLKKPLAIVYWRLQADGKRNRCWLLLLPCGARAVVWVGQKKNSLRTCYFSGAVGVKPKGVRWRAALRQLVQEYAFHDDTTNEFVYPAATYRLEIQEPPEQRFGIRFATAQNWGFENAAAGSRWRPPHWNWPELGGPDAPKPADSSR